MGLMVTLYESSLEKIISNKSFGSRVYMKHGVTVALRVVIIHVEKCSGQEHNVPTPKTDTRGLNVMG
jgi:hypothetical protein